MPIYVYKCKNGHQVPVKQSMADDPLDKCPECDANCYRAVQATNVVYKAGGFYKKEARIGRNGANDEPPRSHS